MSRHYHIRWLPSGKRDWQRFNSAEEAQKTAEDLVLPEESYVVEPGASDCEACAIFEASAPGPKNMRATPASD